MLGPCLIISRLRRKNASGTELRPVRGQAPHSGRRAPAGRVPMEAGHTIRTGLSTVSSNPQNTADEGLERIKALDVLTTLPELLTHHLTVRPDDVAYKVYDNASKAWKDLTFKNVYDQVHAWRHAFAAVPSSCAATASRCSCPIARKRSSSTSRRSPTRSFPCRFTRSTRPNPPRSS